MSVENIILEPEPECSSSEDQWHFWLEVFPKMTDDQKSDMFRQIMGELKRRDQALNKAAS
jgi:hypothetical protein